MNGYQIFEKYWDGLVLCASNPHLLTHDAVRLALRLAIHEAAGAQNDTALVAAQNEAAMLRQRLATAQEEAAALRLDAQRTTQPAIEQRIAEVDRRQIAIIAEWLEENEPALYNSPTGGGFGELALLAMRRRDEQIEGLQQQIAAMDADNAGLLAKLTAAEQGWAAAQADADLVALRAAQQPIVVHVNGGADAQLDPTPAAQSGTDWGRNHPAWQGLTDEERGQLDAVASGAKSWRQLDKNLRRNLTQRAIWHMSESGDVSQSQFDGQKPAWMPSANSLASTLGPRWSDLAIPMLY